jgi:hypothetical protein
MKCRGCGAGEISLDALFIIVVRELRKEIENASDDRRRCLETLEIAGGGKEVS